MRTPADDSFDAKGVVKGCRLDFQSGGGSLVLAARYTPTSNCSYLSSPLFYTASWVMYDSKQAADYQIALDSAFCAPARYGPEELHDAKYPMCGVLEGGE